MNYYVCKECESCFPHEKLEWKLRFDTGMSPRCPYCGAEEEELNLYRVTTRYEEEQCVQERY